MHVTSSPTEQLPDIPLLSAAIFRQITAGVLRDGKTLRFTAYGHSMRPQIQHGDILTIAPLNRLPHLGEVIMLIADMETSCVIVHRVIYLTHTTVTTRGDACGVADGEFPHTAILGVVIKAERGGESITWDKPWHPRFPPRLRSLLSKLNRLIRGKQT